MKAIVIDQPGGPEGLQLHEVPDPEPEHGQVRVKVAACGVNHLDLWVREGLPGAGPWPHIPGSEVSGTVDRLGPGVEGLDVGQSVIVVPGRGCGRCPLCHAGREQICPDFRVLGNQRQGGYAEYVVVEAGDCVPVSDRWPLVEWAAIPLVFQTAWHMLFDLGGLQPGQDVLIESAGSGVGTAALQLVKLVGARAVTTAGGEPKRQRLEALGADLALDYQATDVRKAVRAFTGGRGVDLVFSHVGGPTFTQSMACLARGGRLVTCGATAGPVVEIDLRFVFTRELSISGAYLGTRSDLDQVVHLANQGKIHPTIEHIYPLSDAPAAHLRMGDRSLVGKLLLAP